MAVGDLTINAERSTVVDFSYPFWFSPTGIAAKVEILNSIRDPQFHETMKTPERWRALPRCALLVTTPNKKSF